MGFDNGMKRIERRFQVLPRWNIFVAVNPAVVFVMGVAELRAQNPP